jgi:hypothetical protein
VAVTKAGVGALAAVLVIGIAPGCGEDSEPSEQALERARERGFEAGREAAQKRLEASNLRGYRQGFRAGLRNGSTLATPDDVAEGVNYIVDFEPGRGGVWRLRSFLEMPFGTAMQCDDLNTCYEVPSGGSTPVTPQLEQEPECDPNYIGNCLDPAAPDYDCINGPGDGPAYTGTVSVVGSDHFGLDRDGNGLGCE